MIAKDFKDLSLFVEQPDIVEYQGELYYIGDNPEEMIQKGFEFEDGELEKTDYICSRRNVGCKPLEDKPYILGYDHDDKFDPVYEGARIVSKENGILPDSNKVVLRQIIKDGLPENYSFSKPDHVVYSQEDSQYYCLSNTCTECRVKPHIVPAVYQVVSADISAQEPMASTLVSREPKWAEVFELKNFRMDPFILQYMDIIFESHLRIPKRDPMYVMWVHDTFFYDRTGIYKLNYLVNICKADQDKIPELERHISSLISMFEEYKTNKESQNV